MPSQLCTQVITETIKLQTLQSNITEYNTSQVKQTCNNAIKIFRECIDNYGKQIIADLEKNGIAGVKPDFEFTEKVVEGFELAYSIAVKQNVWRRGIDYHTDKYVDGVTQITKMSAILKKLFSAKKINQAVLTRIIAELKKELPYQIDGDHVYLPHQIVYQHFYEWLSQDNSQQKDLVCDESLKGEEEMSEEEMSEEEMSFDAEETFVFDEKLILNNPQMFAENVNGLTQVLKSIEENIGGRFDLDLFSAHLKGLDKNYQILLHALKFVIDKPSSDIDQQFKQLQITFAPYHLAELKDVFEEINNTLGKSNNENLDQLLINAGGMQMDFEVLGKVKTLVAEIIAEKFESAADILDKLVSNEKNLDEELIPFIDLCQQSLEINRPQQSCRM